jgi:hypothetical protein
MSEGSSQTPGQVIATTFAALDAGKVGSVTSGGRNKMLQGLTRLAPRRTATAMAARILS